MGVCKAPQSDEARPLGRAVLRRDSVASKRCLTFEVRRDRRQDARPGLVKMYAYHQPGPGGLPLGLASTEGLGVADVGGVG
jgi:hypothetical protein